MQGGQMTRVLRCCQGDRFRVLTTWAKTQGVQMAALWIYPTNQLRVLARAQMLEGQMTGVLPKVIDSGC